jgi:LysM repeat protein
MALLLIAVAILAGMAVAGARSLQKRNQDIWSVSRLAPGSTPQVASSGLGGIARLAPTDPVPLLTPTPDAPHALPNLRTQVEQHTVQPGESLGRIAQRYSVSLAQIVEENRLADPNLLEVGQVLTIPLPDPSAAGPAFKIVPDSELVNSPAAVDFDIAAFIQEHGGYLARHTEEVDGRPTSGAQIVERVALEYSVNPRLLLAVLEYQGGWLSNPDPREGKKDYPIGVRNPARKGLYYELSWAANNLNRGYYLWRVNGIGAWLLGDGDVVPINPTINAGTAGVQHMFSVLDTRSAWEQAVGESGVYGVYRDLFGNPFYYVLEPLVPTDLQQPAMQLPFEPGKEWSFTGGPHGGWGDGSAWAALDFAPPGEALGCVLSTEWVTAIADGLVVRSADGVVVQDLDGDGNEQTGWAVLYLHVDQQERAPVGKYLAAGERIGHPSCEGGVSAGTHVHLARKYNGEWISADQQTPFNLEGWVSSSQGQEYDGYLERGGRRIEAYDGRAPENAISR